MDYKKISTIEAIALIVIVMINQVLISVAKDIIIDTASGGWLHTIFISILAVLLFLVMNKLFSKFLNLNIIDISDYLAGKFLKTIVCILLIGFFILSATIIIGNMCRYINVIYLSNISILYLILTFLVASIVVAKREISVIVKNNLMGLYILFVPMLILFCMSFFDTNFSSLFPILGYGFKETFLYNTTNIYAFSGLIYLFLINPLLNDTTKYKKIGIVSIIISSIYLFLTIISLLLQLPFSYAIEDLFSVYLLSRILSLGSFLERVDALYFFVWILNSFSYLSIILYFLTDTFKQMSNSSNRTGSIYAFGSIILGFVLTAKDITDLRFLQRNVFSYYTIILFLILFIILLISYFKNKKKPFNTKKGEAIK